MRYYYYKLLKPDADVNGNFVGTHYGSLKKVRATSKGNARKMIEKRKLFRTYIDYNKEGKEVVKEIKSPFKFISKRKAKKIMRRKQK